MLNDEAGLFLLGEDEAPTEKQGTPKSQKLLPFQIPDQLIFHLADIALLLQRDPSGLAQGFVDLDLGSSPGWWAATVATYCPSRMV